MPEQLTGRGIRKLDRDDKKVVKRPVFFLLVQYSGTAVRLEFGPLGSFDNFSGEKKRLRNASIMQTFTKQ